MTARTLLAGVALLVSACGSPSPPDAPTTIPPGHSPSYQQGYSSTHDYYSNPKNRDYYEGQAQDHGYDAALTCRFDVAVGPKPANEDDWMRGCVDALHDLGLK